MIAVSIYFNLIKYRVKQKHLLPFHVTNGKSINVLQIWIVMLSQKKINIKNRTCYYFDDIIKIEDLNLHNILIDEKSYKNISFYNISYNLIDAKPLRIRFDKVDGFIRVYDGTR